MFERHGSRRQAVRRVTTCVLGVALVLPTLPSAPAAAEEGWSDPQSVASSPSPDPRTTLAETADGTVVAITRGSDGEFRRSLRSPGGDWLPDGVFEDPDGLELGYVEAVAVTRDSAGWFVYSVAGSSDVRVVRWAPDGARAVVGGIVDPWTTVDMVVDDEGDVLLTYGQRGGYPLSAIYGNAADGLASLDIPSWTGEQRPHQWALGPGDDVMLASRFGSALRTVDVGRDGDSTTRTLDRRSGGLADEVVAAISPSGTQYVAWTTAPEDGPRTVHLARRPPDGAWLGGRVVARRGESSLRQRSLEVRPTRGGAYLAWIQQLRSGSPTRDAFRIRGALVRSGRAVLAHDVAGPREAGGPEGLSDLAMQVGQRGRLLVAWTARKLGRSVVNAARGRLRAAPVTTPLFEMDAFREPVVLLRAAGEATVAGTSPSDSFFTTGDVVLRSSSTD